MKLERRWAVSREARCARGCTMLVLEDPGVRAARPLLGGPMEVGLFMPPRPPASQGWAKLNGRDLVTRTIKPANIW